jgi:flagella basal body P-ring formation protein FlgA
MKIDHGTQNTDNRLQRIILISAVCVLTSVFLCLSNSKAATCNPENELRSYLSDNYPWEEIEVSNVQVSDKLSDECPERIHVEKGPLGSAVFVFIFSDNEKVLVSADVKAYSRVIMTRRPLQKRHVIEEEDIYLSKMDIGKLPGNALKDPGKILGKSLKRSINANITIKEDMIEMSQIVERGRSVVLLLSHEGMIIRTNGKTKEKGYVGMPVKAINDSSKKVVSGVLIDENTVKVEL